MRHVFFERSGQPLRGIELEQILDARPVVPRFHVRRSFVYRDARRGEEVVVPDNFVTDLASVPWPFWWLVAAYGRHTAAAIVHDVLIGKRTPLEERRDADALFFRALEASASSWFRHRLMWVGVSVGGTMRAKRPLLLVLFAAHVLAFWIAAAGAFWWGAGSLLAAVGLAALGFAWRAAPTAVAEYAWWMWAVAALGVVLVSPVVLMMLSIGLVIVVDWLAAALRYLRTRRWTRPTPHPMFGARRPLRPEAVAAITPPTES